MTIISRRAATIALCDLVLLACGGGQAGAPPVARAARIEEEGMSDLQMQALGRIIDVPLHLRPAFTGKGFEPPPPRRPGDWLSLESENGQMFEAYTRTFPPVPSRDRDTLVLLPLGDLSVRGEILREYIEAFYGMPVRLLPVDTSPAWTSLARVDKASKRRHLFASDVVQYVESRLPADAFTLIGMTEDALHSDGSWGFVLGQSSPESRVAIFTFDRSVPIPPRGTNITNDPKMLARYLKVTSHKVGHAFGIAHCVFFSCLMAGAASVEESDLRPLHLCPVCMRKIAWATKTDLRARYRKLKAFYTRYSMPEEAAWIGERLQELAVTQPLLDAGASDAAEDLTR